MKLSPSTALQEDERCLQQKIPQMLPKSEEPAGSPAHHSPNITVPATPAPSVCSLAVPSLQTLCRLVIQKHVVHRLAIDGLDLPPMLKHFCQHE